MPEGVDYVKVLIEDMPAYRARHGLRIVRAYWPKWSRCPIVEVERVSAPDKAPQKEAASDDPATPGS